MSRVRTACPQCKCLSITKLVRLGGYVCRSCKHRFNIPLEVVPKENAFDRNTYMRRYRRTHTEASKYWEAANRERRA